jgi:hypothetical protein
MVSMLTACCAWGEAAVSGFPAQETPNTRAAAARAVKNACMKLCFMFDSLFKVNFDIGYSKNLIYGP